MTGLERAPIVFGHDATEGLIAFDLAPEGRHVVVYRRTRDGVARETVAFAPFLLVGDPELLGEASRVSVRRLDGDGALAWLATFASWADALAGRDAARDRSGRAPGAPDAPYLFMPDPVAQYLLASGRTSFGGLAFGDLRRLALDIEVITTDGYEFPAAARPDDRIVAVALADSTGFRHVVRGDRLDEPALLRECSRLIRERDPDVIEGHNIFRFDLEYLEARARRHGVTLDWGRDGSALRGRPARLSIAERSIGYRRYEIAGRHIVDTWILAQFHDVGARDLPSFGLKDIARRFGVAAAGRTYVEGAAVSREFREAPDRLMAYAGDDAVETLAVSAIFSPPHFAQAQLVPFDYQSTILRGAAAKIDALLLREYLRRGHAVPAPRAGTSVGGGHVALYQQGLARPALHVDVTSLYPSLMLAGRIAPVADDLGVFPALLRHLTDFRVAAKRRAQEATDAAERAHLLALQQSFKILINAFYGYLAFGGGHWNDFEAANRVTADGRDVVLAIIERLGARGATVLEADTDGVYFVPPPEHRPEDDEALLAAAAEGLPAGVRLELDGRYAAMFSYKAKTYALLDDRGRVTLRGSGFRSRGLEPFQRALIEEIVRLLLEGRGRDVKAVVDRWLGDFAARRVPPKLFARTETLQDTLETYRDRLAAGARNPSAAYELASASGRVWQPGDQVSYYVAGRGAGVAVNEHARLLAAWDPERRDENVEFYQAKVYEVWERFRAFTEQEGLRPPPGDDEPQLSLF
ncbi:MAG: DNA polymerase II [Candidatus Rokubacteria bacterium]|nr:DNA polymerase II [Candidatus Rokubacteria bacterium]